MCSSLSKRSRLRRTLLLSKGFKTSSRHVVGQQDSFHLLKIILVVMHFSNMKNISGFCLNPSKTCRSSFVSLTFTPLPYQRQTIHDPQLHSEVVPFQKNEDMKRDLKNVLVHRHQLSNPFDNGFTIKISRFKRIPALFVLLSIIGSPFSLDLDNGCTRHFPRPAIVQSAARALSDDQLLVSDVWKEVTRQFVDQSFNGLGEEKWKRKRMDAVKAIQDTDPDNRSAVYNEIRNMLKNLGDPYTRFLTPDQFESLTAYAKGKTSGGIGVQLLVDPSINKVVVMNTSPGSPAAESGILPGDVIVDVNGEEMLSATAEVVASACRGDPGTQVQVSVKRDKGKGDSQKITMTRSAIKSNPVQASTFQLTMSKSNHKATVGVLKVPAFSQTTVVEIVDQLRDLTNNKESTPEVIVVDVRGNPGGYLPAGIDAAKLFLRPESVVISEVNKSGTAKVYKADGVGSETDTKLYVLVDSRTASAAEILTAALQDNDRATVVGVSKTFGKGRIQNVQGPLIDGSGLAVTKAKYMTPNGRDIQGIGIVPDTMLSENSCKPEDDAKTCLNDLIATTL